MKRQNQVFSSWKSDCGFNPHKYFGGWNENERASIDMIQYDNRLKDMMEYETSNASISASWSYADISSSLATPSVAEEFQPSSPIQKSGHVFDFKLKSSTKKEVNKAEMTEKVPVSKAKLNNLKDISTPEKYGYYIIFNYVFRII